MTPSSCGAAEVPERAHAADRRRGRPAQGRAERELAERYRDRVAKAGRALGLRDIEIIEIRESRAPDAAKRVLEESIALANIIPERAVVVALDEPGESSRQRIDHGRAARLARRRASAPWSFCIGGADGLGDELRRRADLHARLRRRDLAASARANHAAGAALPGGHDPGRPSLSSRLILEHFRRVWTPRCLRIRKCDQIWNLERVRI